MDIQLYNTLTRSKEVFNPLEKGEVSIYSCGPTVYQRPHIGNYRAFVFADVLRRTFLLNEYKVHHVMNITDVGHLVGDGDEGQDKMMRQALQEGKTAWDIAKMYTEMFEQDMEALHILPFDQMPKATDHIDQQIAMVSTLEEKGFAYRTSDGVYFDTSRLEDYGKLSGQSLDEKQEGARVAVNDEKRNPTDFALWKLSKPEEERHMEWSSPWGVGFPGWHIECSAMAEEYLGKQFDIHTGGIDHIPVHHTNEIAQSEGVNGVIPAHTWMHLDFLRVDDQKMSKSLGNVYSLADIEGRGFDAIDLRYFFLGAHYRSSLNFTWGGLKAAHAARRRLENLVRNADSSGELIDSYVSQFTKSINDDLNTPRALAVAWELISDNTFSQEDVIATLLHFDSIFGLGLQDCMGKKLVIPKDVQRLIDERRVAREAGDYEKSDVLRAAIAVKGYIVRDTDEGQVIEEM